MLPGDATARRLIEVILNQTNIIAHKYLIPDYYFEHFFFYMLILSTHLFELNELKHIYSNTENQNNMVRALTLFICQRNTNCKLRSCDIPS